MSMIFCRGCGKEIHETAAACPSCGAPQSKTSSGFGKKQNTAFLLSFFLGGLGAHRFYLGSIGLGFLYLFTFGLLGIGALVDMFNLAFMRSEAFAAKYNNGGIGQPIGIWAKGLVMIFPLLIVMVIGKSFYSGYKERHPSADSTTGQSDKFSDMAGATPAQLSPTGELAAMFNLMSDNTDLQRENKFKEIKGKIVEWTLPVYEVEKDGSAYKVQTDPSQTVGAFVYITARTDQDKAIIEGLKTGSRLSFKGVISDVTMRHLEIKPAILFQPGSVKQVAIEVQKQPALTEPSIQPQQVDAVEQTGLCMGLDSSVTPDQLECADREFKSADKQLNGTYKQLMASLEGSQKTILKKEQIAWIKEKEAKCTQEGEEAGGGQLGTVVTARCNVFMTEQRLTYLQKYK